MCFCVMCKCVFDTFIIKLKKVIVGIWMMENMLVGYALSYYK
jgi:hypothetical protein